MELRDMTGGQKKEEEEEMRKKKEECYEKQRYMIMYANCFELEGTK